MTLEPHQLALVQRENDRALQAQAHVVNLLRMVCPGFHPTTHTLNIDTGEISGPAVV